MHGGDWRQTFSEGQVLQASEHDQKLFKIFGVYGQTTFVVSSSLPRSPFCHVSTHV